MMKTVRVRHASPSGTEAATRNQAFDNGRAVDTQKPYLHKLMLGLYIGQLITMIATSAALGSFVISHGKEIDRLKENSGRIEAKLDGEVSSNKEQMAMIQQLATNLTPSADVTKTIQDVGVLTLSNRLKKLEASVDVHNNSILELEQTFNNFVFSNQTETIKVLEKNLNDQNSSIHSVDEKVLQLKSEHELDRNIVTELKASVRLIEENVTANEMTSVTERIRTQLNHEQLKENMTAYSIDLFAYSKRLDDFEARTNSSETSLVDHDSRIGQIELWHLSEIILNEEQKTQINELEEEINKTWSAVQGFGKGSTDRAVGGNWTDWTVWSCCSQTCGDGQMTRGRFCVNPRPANGGQDCVGAAEEQQTCNIGNCPVNGAWTTWSSCSGCSRTCGSGLSHRQRSCTDPSPAGNGRGCTGNSKDTQQCETTKCTDYQSAFAISALEPTFDSSGIVAIFSSTKTNIGNHYDTNTGKFTCQYAGAYVFVLNLYKKPQAGRIWCWIMKNGSGRAIAQVPSDSGPGFHGGSGTTVDHLVPGDKVYVGNCGDDRSNIDDRTSFVGFMLYAD